jgi:hypothetical protein
VMPMRPSTVLLSCAIAGFLASAAFAQAINYTSVEATAGKPLQLTYHASAHKSNCTPAPLATFDVLQAPKLGVLVVRKAMLTTDKVAGCPGLKIPAEVVFYRGREGSAGTDHVVYKVTSSSGEVETFDVTITLKPAPSPAPAPSPPSSRKDNSL